METGFLKLSEKSSLSFYFFKNASKLQMLSVFRGQNNLGKQMFIFKSNHTSLFLNFIRTLVFQKNHSFFQVIFRATQLRQMPKDDLFQKALFCTFTSITNLGLNTFPIAAVQYFWRSFTFSIKSWWYFKF